MQIGSTQRGNTETYLVHIFGRGLEDDRYVVERFRSAADGEITPAPTAAPPTRGRKRRPRHTVTSLSNVTEDAARARRDHRVHRRQSRRQRHPAVGRVLLWLPGPGLASLSAPRRVRPDAPDCTGPGREENQPCPTSIAMTSAPPSAGAIGTGARSGSPPRAARSADAAPRSPTVPCVPSAPGSAARPTGRDTPGPRPRASSTAASLSRPAARMPAPSRSVATRRGRRRGCASSADGTGPQRDAPGANPVSLAAMRPSGINGQAAAPAAPAESAVRPPGVPPAAKTAPPPRVTTPR